MTTPTLSSSEAICQYQWSFPNTQAENNTASTNPQAVAAAAAAVNQDQMNGNEDNTSTKTRRRDEYVPLPKWGDWMKLEPWVLVPNGSWKGFFDFVPLQYRVGPWSRAAKLYLLVLAFGVILAPYTILLHENPQTHHLHKYQLLRTNNSHYTTQSYFSDVYIPLLLTTVPSLSRNNTVCVGSSENSSAYYDGALLYNATAFLWMVGSILYLLRQPLGAKAWVTYTVQSWTLLTLRHGLCALSLLFPHIPSITIAAEITRFPSIVSATITFVVWNFAVMPVVLYLLPTKEKRHQFFRFCMSPKLFNLHFVNMVLVCTNALYASPRRELVLLDLYWAIASVVIYMMLYFFILDRLGVHLYPVFSPRLSATKIVAIWTIAFIVYVITFHVWRHLMMPSLDNDGTSVGECRVIA